jgi:4-amino-4-deoxy-L-arabinose transferase-like glycosyltransferase
MAETTVASTQAEPDPSTKQPGQRRFLPWHRLALGGIALIAIYMNFFQLGKNGFSTYYPPAIKSMMESWQNFFFAAYDPAGFVSIDKPPVGFWFQVISAKIFGFNSVSVLLPQALAGVLSVLLLYYLVRRHFGVVAGLLAALVLALCPISVVTNRDVTIDSTLTLTLLIGAWAVMRAAESGQLRWLLLSAFLVGVGFNIKMLQAYLVVPAYGMLYLLAAPHSVWKRMGHLALAGLLLLVVSLSWVVAVDLTPASQRPYVGSTKNNSALSLALGYNGLQRLLGNNLGAPIIVAPGVEDGAQQQPQTPASPAASTPGGDNGAPQSQVSGSPTTSAPGGENERALIRIGGIGFDIGTPGPLRLFELSLGSQIGWLLPLALLGMLALAWQRRPNVREDRKLQSLVLWGMWLLTMGVFFSVAAFFHQYYLTVMAPALAALAGIGLVTMWQDYRGGGWRGWLLPIAVVATAAEQVFLLSGYSDPTWGRWLIPLIVVLSLIAVGALASVRVVPFLRLKEINTRFLALLLGTIGGAALLVAPTVWAILPVMQSSQSLDLPVAGPVQASSGSQLIMKSRPHENIDSLIRYLEANQDQAKFLLAVANSQNDTAGKIMLTTNKAVMAMGGFGGSDPILTLNELETLVKQDTVRFFLLPAMNSQNGPRIMIGIQDTPLTAWVEQHCQVVPTNLWQSPSTGAGTDGSIESVNQLYDCATAHS